MLCLRRVVHLSDDVFVTLVVSVQYVVIPEAIYEAMYRVRGCG